MVKCSMCMFEGGDSLFVLKHVIKRHKNNPTFHVKCQFEGCASSYQKWDSYRKHLCRKHPNAVPQESLQEETQEEPPENAIPHPNADEPEHMDEDVDNNVDLLNQQDDPEDLDPPVSAQELLTWKAGNFLAVLRDDANTSQKAIDVVVQEVHDILGTYLNKIHGELKAARADPQDTSLSYEDIDRIFSELKSQELFSGVSSKYLLDQFLDPNGKVATEKVYLGTEEFWSKTQPPRIVEKDCYAYILPLKNTLHQLLSNPEILNYVLNPVENADDSILKDVRDGSYYKRHILFSTDRFALIIIFYFDDLQTSNIAGSKPHKFSMFYWTLANIPVNLRSSLRAINLCGVVRTKYLKQFGADKVLSSFIANIKKLQTEGMDFAIQGGVRNFRGSMLFVTADTPAAQLLGAMKEGVGAATCPCRSCDATQESMQNSFREVDFTLRDKESHKERVEIVTDPNITRQATAYYSTLYGINGESVFASLTDFDVTKCLVQDFMHVMLEGVLPLEIQLFLKYVVRDASLITLKTLNNLMQSFKFGHLQRGCPSEILEDHLDASLRQNSLQELALGHVLPFLLKPYVEFHDGGLERLNNLVLLLQVCNLALSYEIRHDDVALLEHMITKHHFCFKILYEGVNIIPKMHYMIHFPSQIESFGPLRFQWCLRFEGGHLYFKRLMQVVLCYKNPPLTMCNRFSSKRTVQLLTFRNKYASNFLDLGDKVSKRGRVVPVDGYQFQDVLRVALPTLGVNDSIMIVQCVLVSGTLYKKGSVILIRRELDDFPRFGRVESAIVYGLGMSDLDSI